MIGLVDMSTHRQVDVWMIRVLLIAAPGTVIISRRAAGITLSLRLSSAPGSTRGLKNHNRTSCSKKDADFRPEALFFAVLPVFADADNWFRHDVSPGFPYNITAIRAVSLILRHFIY
jgi:hypothetical protein